VREAQIGGEGSWGGRGGGDRVKEARSLLQRGLEHVWRSPHFVPALKKFVVGGECTQEGVESSDGLRV
jgi:hypothetical protein